MEENELNIEEQQPKRLPHFSKKWLILIGIVFLVLIVGAFFLLSRNTSQQLSTRDNVIVVDSLPQASISFEPNPESSPESITQIMDIAINTQGHEVSGVEIGLNYDPTAISNLQITQTRDNTSAISNAFDEAQITYNEQESSAYISLSIPESTPLQKGRGKIVTITYTRISDNPTIISFLPTTALINRSTLSQVPITTNTLLLEGSGR